MTRWEQPLVSVDVVALRHVDGDIQFATHRRALDPFADWHALPGVLLLAGESLDAAARRAVAEKLVVADPDAIRVVTQFGAFDGTNRDPRGATISIGHLVALEPATRSDATWEALADGASGLPFDHDAIVRAAVEEVARRLWSDWGFTRSLLGEEWTTGIAIAVTRRVGGRLPAPETNLSRWFKSSGLVERAGLRGRDSVWRWAADETSDAHRRA